MDKPCSHCSLRAKYDKNPQSWLGRFWRWHINFCPGWKNYYNSLEEEERNELSSKYKLR